MDLIKKYKIIISIVLPVLILVLIRTFGSGHFKSDAKKWAEPSVERSNLITSEKIGSLPGEKLIINLDDKINRINNMTQVAISIPADSIISKNYLSIIRNHSGSVLLFSYDPAVSARIWMVLSQMGYKNIYILISIDNEVLNYKFRPDTSIKPEL